MEKGILLDLKSIEILSELNVKRLKQYILKKHPGEDNKKQSLVFADAVKRIVNGKIPECDEHAKEKLKSHVLKNALKKQTFSVDCGDVFVSVLEMNRKENILLESFSEWMSSVLKKDIPSEKVKKFVYDVYDALDEKPDLNIETIVQNVDEKANWYDGTLEKTETEIGEESAIENNNMDFEEDYIVGEIVEEISEIDGNKPYWMLKIRDWATPEIIKRCVVFACMVCFVILISRGFFLLGRNSIDIKEPASIRVVESVKEIVLDDGIVAKKLDMRATAYDLSYESCKKDRDHPEYGITYSGRRAVLGRTVAVDPKTIPLDSELYIVFPNEYSHLDGIYVAEDIGSAVKDDIIDVFLGEDKVGESIVAQKVREFGVRNVEVFVLK